MQLKKQKVHDFLSLASCTIIKLNKLKFDKSNFRKMSQGLFDKDYFHFIIKNFIDTFSAMKVKDFNQLEPNNE